MLTLSASLRYYNYYFIYNVIYDIPLPLSKAVAKDHKELRIKLLKVL
jgi:hypothetical protein